MTLGLGALAEEVVVPAAAVVPVPEELPFDTAALLGCAVLTGVGAVDRTAGVRPGDAVLVIGLGGVGLSAVTAARAAGADPLIAVDVGEAKRDLALAAGASHFLVSDDGLSRGGARADRRPRRRSRHRVRGPVGRRSGPPGARPAAAAR